MKYFHKPKKSHKNTNTSIIITCSMIGYEFLYHVVVHFSSLVPKTNAMRREILENEMELLMSVLKII